MLSGAIIRSRPKFNNERQLALLAKFMRRNFGFAGARRAPRFLEPFNCGRFRDVRTCLRASWRPLVHRSEVHLSPLLAMLPSASSRPIRHYLTGRCRP
jgi:hypothetical protein